MSRVVNVCGGADFVLSEVDTIEGIGILFG